MRRAAEALISGRADAAVGASATQLSAQSWGTALALAAAVGRGDGFALCAADHRLSGNLAQPTGDSLDAEQFHSAAILPVVGVRGDPAPSYGSAGAGWPHQVTFLFTLL